MIKVLTRRAIITLPYSTLFYEREKEFVDFSDINVAASSSTLDNSYRLSAIARQEMETF